MNSTTIPAVSRGQIVARFLVRRRIPVSLIFFSSLLATEALLGISWRRVNLGSDLLFGTGMVLVLLGLGIRSWAAGTIRKSLELATSGAYSLCRHPLYLGSFLMILGFCLATQPLFNLLLVAPCVILIYACAIRSEEVRLARLFGDAWERYSETTPRLCPNVLRSQLHLSRWSAKQWCLNREYRAVLTTIAGSAGLCAWYLLG